MRQIVLIAFLLINSMLYGQVDPFFGDETYLDTINDYRWIVSDFHFVGTENEYQLKDFNDHALIKFYKRNNEKCISKYGEKAENGLIILISKKYWKFYNRLSDYSEKIENIWLDEFNYEKYEFYLNNKPLLGDVYNELMSINPKKIASVKFKKKMFKSVDAEIYIDLTN